MLSPGWLELARRPSQDLVPSRHVRPFRFNDVNTPLLNLSSETLLIELNADYVHAQLCNTALHAFAAENDAPMEAMTSLRSQIERKLSALLAIQRIVRQEEITAEIVELAAGETAGRSDRARTDSAKYR
jgi:F-type H+-transporting ATPase subunit gamma